MARAGGVRRLSPCLRAFAEQASGRACRSFASPFGSTGPPRPGPLVSPWPRPPNLPLPRGWHAGNQAPIASSQPVLDREFARPQRRGLHEASSLTRSWVRKSSGARRRRRGQPGRRRPGPRSIARRVAATVIERHARVFRARSTAPAPGLRRLRAAQSRAPRSRTSTRSRGARSAASDGRRPLVAESSRIL